MALSFIFFPLQFYSHHRGWKWNQTFNVISIVQHTHMGHKFFHQLHILNFHVLVPHLLYSRFFTDKVEEKFKSTFQKRDFFFSTLKEKKPQLPNCGKFYGWSHFQNDIKRLISWNLHQWSSSLWSYFFLCDWPVFVSAAKPFPWWCDTPMQTHWWSCRTCLCSLLELHKVDAP